MMKKLYTWILLSLGFLTAWAQTQPSPPVFSQGDSETWYYLQFKAGGGVLADQGNDQEVMTEALETNKSTQLWKFVGESSQFTLINKAGRKLKLDDSGFFSTTSGSGTMLKLYASKNASLAPAWEITTESLEAKKQAMNQYTKSGIGVRISSWSKDDANNALVFLAQKDLPEYPKFSSDTQTHWYYIQFRSGKGVLAEQGDGNNLITQLAAKKDAQLWKLVGSDYKNFQLVSKTGLKIYLQGNRYKASSSRSGQMHLAVASTSARSWVLATTDTKSGQSMNQAGGAGIGKAIGPWTEDSGNPLVFVPEAEMSIPQELPASLNEYSISSSESYKPKHLNTLWYKRPAIDVERTSQNPWMEYALPIGDGQFGAMIHAGVHQDLIQFNEKTLWAGDAKNYGSYLNFGHLYIEDLSGATQVKDYVRYLDLETATAGMSYKSQDGTTTYTREYIASNPHRVIAIRLKASQPGKLHHKFYLYNANGSAAKYAKSRRGTTAHGSFAGTLDLVSYNAYMRISTTGGQIKSVDANGIEVEGAEEILVLLSGGTNYDETHKEFISTSPQQLATNMELRCQAAAFKKWDGLYASHVEDYKELYDRVKLDLTGAKNEHDTFELVNQYNSAAHQTGREPIALMLEQLYFNYGRYLMIASSRGVDLPSNLQGIWNNRNNPPWKSDIHANINVQMNYWPAESLNLSELHRPFLNYIYNMAIVHEQWRENAKKAKQTVGWTCYTENNIYGYHGGFMHNYVIANAWYCSHLWQHYRYTLDRKFLKEVALPVMQSASEFWLERLIKDDDGKWVAPNEYSPEHGPNENGVAHAQQLIWDLFDSTLKALEILGSEASVSETFKRDLKAKFADLDPGLATEEVEGRTLLREWKYTSGKPGQNKVERGHRHMSHLMALYPLTQVTPESEYFQPIINSLDHRGDASTGWSMGWKINLWARALNGDRARRILRTALKHSTSYGTDQSRGGIYYNLFDSHAPFQIDGNFGAAAGIGEMLLQSQHGILHLLPALPSAWQEGQITGMRAVGNFGVDLKWASGKLVEAKIMPVQDGPCQVRYAALAKGTLTDSKGQPVAFERISEEQIKFQAKARETYLVKPDPSSTFVETLDFTTEGISVEGHTVRLLGQGMTTQVYDLQGHLLLTTDRTTFALPLGAGQVFLLKSQGQGGTKCYKVVLN